ncbi:YesL family protein [Fundicoccus ignavus]|uniref:DUF624 domain-containing protein n=1 Tax=Fundicoccus ignavus TaxID=2664442 RepID=A0A844BY89_9LACT|nr:DUF624 domain-containing protein [Fundicoccus ignavus]MRJ46974.1 DUF624 domain-containing protein [Fundicoccus ignavus]
MKFNPDGTLYKLTTVTSQFIFLNVLYIISCIPIVTIGVATSALFEVLLRYADDERGNLIRDYFIALKSNWKQASLAYLCLFFPIALLIYSSTFWFSIGSILSSIVGVVAAIIAAYLLTVFLFSMALIGRYQNTLRQTLKNACLIAVADPIRALGVLLIPVTLFCLMVIFPGFRLFLPLFGFVLMAYCCAFLLLSIFKRWN